MVREHEHEYPSQWKAIESISKKSGINHETLRIWVRRAETDACQLCLPSFAVSNDDHIL
jgi:transposase